MKAVKLMTVATLLAIGTVAGAQSMKIDAKASNVEWLGKKVTGQHTGDIHVSTGELSFDGNGLTGVLVMMDMNSITNGDIDDAETSKKLVGHLKSPDFFDVENHPKATFKSTKVEAMDDGKYKVTGDLTIKGKTGPVTVEAAVTKADGSATATGTLVFDRSKYDVRYGSGSFFEGLGDKMIYDDVELTFNIVAKAK